MTKYEDGKGIIVQINPDVPPTGSDLGITNAARKSFGKRSELVEGKLKEADKRLLGFLARGLTADDFEYFKEEVVRLGYNTFNASDPMVRRIEVDMLLELLWEWRNTPTHDTPINHGFFSFEVQCPIWVRAQLVKHEYTILSEYSRRYITSDVEFYGHQYRNKAEDKKQGSVGVHEASDHWNKKVQLFNKDALDLYNSMVDAGVAPEQARGVLPQDLLTSFTWSGTFGAFVKMCKLRLASDAQAETRFVAECVYKELEKQFPISAPLFVKGT